MEEKKALCGRPCGVRQGDRDSYRRGRPYPPRGPRHGIHERGVPSVLSRSRHQAGVCPLSRSERMSVRPGQF